MQIRLGIMSVTHSLFPASTARFSHLLLRSSRFVLYLFNIPHLLYL